ncbi:hypothetical protein BC833DRAFT_562392 [Globomyces pollinis-pini]|nr:hypothetical protein BC833DRAFT_562392 [Globomyces pollinis-pini]
MPLNTQCPETDSKEGYINRFKKSNNVILSGSPLPLKPRPPPMVSNSVVYQDTNDAKEEPSIYSELIRGGHSFQDPYANFFDDITGWDEDASENSISKMLIESNCVSYKYLSCDEINNTPDVPPPVQAKKRPYSRKRLSRPQTEQGRKSDIKNIPTQELEFEEDMDKDITLHFSGINDREKEDLLELPIEQISLLDTPELLMIPFSSHNSKTEQDKSQVQFDSTTTKQETEPEKPSGSLNKIQQLRKKLCFSASPLKSKQNMTTQSLGMTVLTGKKYYRTAESDTITTNRLSRAKTAEVGGSRTTLPLISSPSCYSLSDNGTWGVIKGVSAPSNSQPPTSEKKSIESHPAIETNNSSTNLQSLIFTTLVTSNHKADTPWLLDQSALKSPSTPSRRIPKKLSAYGFRAARIPVQQGTFLMTKQTSSNKLIDTAPPTNTLNIATTWGDFNNPSGLNSLRVSSRSFRNQIHMNRSQE